MTKPVDIDAAEMNAARNDRSEVADLIIRDLQEAIPDLPRESEISTADKLSLYSFQSEQSLHHDDERKCTLDSWPL